MHQVDIRELISREIKIHGFWVWFGVLFFARNHMDRIWDGVTKMHKRKKLYWLQQTRIAYRLLMISILNMRVQKIKKNRCSEHGLEPRGFGQFSNQTFHDWISR